MNNKPRYVTRKKFRQGMRSNAHAYRYYRGPGTLEFFADAYAEIFGEHHELVELERSLIKARENGTLRKALLDHGFTNRWAVRRGKRGVIK